MASEKDRLEGIIGRLKGELDRLGSEFPLLSFRFCRIMGRRVSHLAGEVRGPVLDELRLPAGPGLMLMVRGPWRDREECLREHAAELAARLGGTGPDGEDERETAPSFPDG